MAMMPVVKMPVRNFVSPAGGTFRFTDLLFQGQDAGGGVVVVEHVGAGGLALEFIEGGPQFLGMGVQQLPLRARGQRHPEVLLHLFEPIHGHAVPVPHAPPASGPHWRCTSRGPPRPAPWR